MSVVGTACQLRVSGTIDREVSGQYIIVIGVREEARRTKRQVASQQTPYGIPSSKSNKFLVQQFNNIFFFFT